ncbi:MAG: AsmA-like C-terminal region-containing protein [Muribaculaceae bacterium]|nr:AsmA-like C-terminal region-containing protein [Muribaculaceae bacterium]
MTTATMKHPDRKTPLWRNALRLTLWILMCVILIPLALIMCTVRTLTPEHLTPLVSRIANELLDAEVSVGKVELSVGKDFPLLHLTVDSVTVISSAVKNAPDSLRKTFPAWGDTLFTVKHFEGGVNIDALLTGNIRLHDVEFVEPSVNLLAVNDSLTNYWIYTPAPDTVKTAVKVPHISINRFALTRPKPLRFSNLATHQHFDIALQSLSISSTSEPLYAVNLGGNVAGSQLNAYNLGQVSFGIDGGIGWNPENPSEVVFNSFKFRADFIEAAVDARVNFGHDITVSDYALHMGRVGVDNLLSLVPDSLLSLYKMSPEEFSTTVGVTFEARSTAPFNLTTDSLPHADIRIDITPGKVRYGQAELTDVSGSLLASLVGNDLNAASFEISDFKASGPATDLVVNAHATEVAADALVRGHVSGHTDLSRLPSRVLDMINGYLSGKIDVELEFEGRPSMLTPNEFHRLKARGDIHTKELYFLSSDTVNMVYAHDADIRLGTDGYQGIDSLLVAKVKIDSADILHQNYSIELKDFALGAGVSNRRPSADTTLVVPMGGDLKIGKFSLVVLGDSITVMLRDAHGRLSMQRYRDHARLPLIGLDMDIARLSTGTPDMRFMLSGSTLHTTAHMLPPHGKKHKVRKAAAAISHAHPDLPPEQVYAHAIRVVHDKPKGKYPRIHPEMTDSTEEIMYWGTSKLLRALLTDWRLKGSLKSRRGGLYTPYFPLRNRMRDFNVTFNNDTIIMENIRYKVGGSDIQMSGRVSNLARALTSEGFRSPLKLNFSLASDTIDLNELAGASFRGSAYAEGKSRSHHHRKFNIDSLMALEDASDADFEREMGRIVADSPDSMAPLLIPRNIDAIFDLRVANMLYSDMRFRDLQGEILAADGAVSLNDLNASSEMGSVNFSALYAAPAVDSLKFGFGLEVDRFNLERFITLMPTLDSIMPVLRDFRGIIDADIAATCRLDRGMNLLLPTLTAAVSLRGDSLVLIDPETYSHIGKWLRFKNRHDNVIRNLNVELTVRDNMLELYPLIFNIDRYQLGLEGHNDLAMNFNYHIAVLRSPLPFRFGINISGNPRHHKIRLGKARMSENQVVRAQSMADTVRVNLVNSLRDAFSRGVANSRFAQINLARIPTSGDIDLNADTISHADSLVFIREGLIPAPAPRDSAQSKVKRHKK